MKRVLFTLFILSCFLGKSFGQAEVNFVFNLACKGDSTTMIAQAAVPTPDSITYYSWDLNGDFTFGDAYGPVLTKLWPIPGTYDVGLKIYTKLGLMESIYRQIPIVDITANFSSENFCFGDVTKFFNLSTSINSPISNFEWDFGTTYLSNLENPTYTYLATGNYNISLKVSTANGCTAQKSDIIYISPVPEIALNYSLTPVSTANGVPTFQFFRGQSLTANVVIKNAFTDIIWSNKSHNDTLVITETGYYTVEVVNDKGCSTSLGFNVLVVEDTRIVPMPVITPNADGWNDEFKIKEYLMPGEKFELKIYNRYGDEVYASSDYRNDWKGTYKGNKLPDGSYYYYLKDKNSGTIYKGAVNILTNK
ncbi:MAG: gliding motility-associated C-terminal domain-containing protein [Bacteroidetes bacterium]|nr:gliding motility-associated C-terminal domain-containing protein [Bacteroidota bacterium]